MLEDGDQVEDFDDEPSEEMNILEQLNKLNLEDDDDVFKPDANSTSFSQQEAVPLSQASKGILNPSNPVFERNHLSSKVSKFK